MSSVFSRNAILSGCVDFYCLACEAQLRTDEDAILHIAKPIHKKNLEGTSFLDKYRDDRVRKVKKGYYCECCNIFMRTAAKVGPHVAEAKHQENMAARPLRREGNGVLAFDSVLISENAFHGLIDDTCSVCDAEFDNAQIHKTDTWHALNLVLVEIEISGDNVYRKVDDSTFQCLTCNMVCAISAMATHFEDADHKKLYQQCYQSAKTKANETKETPDIAKEDKQRKSPEKETKKVEKEEKAKKPEVEKVKEQRMSPEKDLPKDPKIPEKKSTEVTSNISNGVKEDKTEKGPKDGLGKTDKEICKNLGAVDYIARDVCGKQWCILCDWSMDDSAVLAHINSRHHQTILKMHKERADKKPLEFSDHATSDKVPFEYQNLALNSATVQECQKNGIELDVINDSAFCRKCSERMTFDFRVIRAHLDDHKKEESKPKAETKEAKAFPTVVEQKSHIAHLDDHKKDESKPKAETKEVKAFPIGAEKKSSTNLFTAPVHKNDPKPKERQSRASSASLTREVVEIEAFAKQNNLTYTKDNNNAFCRVCVSKIPASIKNMKEHINGMAHKNKIAKTTVQPTVKAPTMTPSHIFIDTIITIENMFSKDIVINDKYVVNIFSFMMITKTGAKFRCQACEMNVSVSQIDAHKNTPKHERAMNDAMVVSSADSEFIREIRQNLYHCGYCNQLEATWPTMEAHLMSTNHREAKTAASWRMIEYAPMISQHKARQRMEFQLFTRMLMGQMFSDD